MGVIKEHHGNMAEHAKIMVGILTVDEGCTPDQLNSMKQIIIEGGYPEDNIYDADSVTVVKLMKVMKSCGITHLFGHVLQHTVLANALTDAKMKSDQELS